MLPNSFWVVSQQLGAGCWMPLVIGRHFYKQNKKTKEQKQNEKENFSNSGRGSIMRIGGGKRNCVWRHDRRAEISQNQVYYGWSL